MAASTLVGPALLNVARAAGSVGEWGASSSASKSRICAGASHLLSLAGGGGRFPSRRRFLLTGTGMLGIMSSSVAPQARAAGVSEAEQVLQNIQCLSSSPSRKKTSLAMMSKLNHLLSTLFSPCASQFYQSILSLTLKHGRI